MPASQPRVIAIVVNHNGRAFLRDTFRGLAAQTRPIDDVLVVDTGSTDGSADWAGRGWATTPSWPSGGSSVGR